MSLHSVSLPSGFQTNRCPKCNSQEYSIVFSGHDYLHNLPGEFFVSKCGRCHLLFQNPSPTPEKISEFYPDNYGPHSATGVQSISFPELPASYKRYLSERLGYQHLADSDSSVQKPEMDKERVRAGIELIPSFVPDGRLLEIGCATGNNLAYLRHLGWQNLHGIEFVQAAADRARESGFQVQAGAVEDCIERYEDNSFDVIVASMVLEHLYNPFDVVNKIASKLKPGGEFLFSTIVCDSLDAKIYGSYFAGFDFPRHLVHFRKNDILDMLDGQFGRVEAFHQNAPIDYIRSSTWRFKPRSLNVFDRFILKHGNSKFVFKIGELLARMGLTCRVSYRCRKAG